MTALKLGKKKLIALFKSFGIRYGRAIQMLPGTFSLNRIYKDQIFSRERMLFTILTVIFCCLITSSGRSSWITETVDGATRGKYNSMAMDRQGHLHISTYDVDNGCLVYLKQDPQTPTGWILEIVDDSSPEVGIATSLALDTDGNPHISYVDKSDNDLKYARRDSSGWYMEIVADSSPDQTSIALDSRGFPHIICSNSRVLDYAWRDESGWHLESLDVPVQGASLTLDSNDIPHVSFETNYSSTDCELKYASRDESGWHCETVKELDPCYYGSWTDLKLDSDEHPHIVFYDDHQMISYASNIGSTWVIENIDALDNSLECPSMQLDSQNFPHVSYHHFVFCDPCPPTYALKYAFRDDSGWHVQTLDGSSKVWVGMYSALVLDSNGFSNIAYYDLKYMDLKLAIQDSSGWNFQRPFHGGSVGKYNSLKTDDRGNIHICYSAESNNALKYAVNDGNGWIMETVKSYEEIIVKSYLLQVDTDGYPHIVFYAMMPESGYHWKSELLYAFKSDAGWRIENLACCYAYNDGTSFVLDSGNYPHISIYDDNYPGLVCFYKDEFGWYSEIIDDDSSAGKNSSLVIDDHDNLYIAYNQDEPGKLKYGFRDAAGWHTSTLDTEGDEVGNPSLAIDSKDQLHIAYIDYSKEQIIYGVESDNNWHFETAVDSDIDADKMISFTLAPDDTPRITFQNESSPAIRIAFKDPTGWHIETVDDSMYYTSHSMDIDASGVVHISYYSKKLKYARESVPDCTELGVSLSMPSDFYNPGDPFNLSVYTCNPGEETYSDIPLFVILDIHGSLYFAPGFSEFDYYTIDLPPGQQTRHIVLDEFSWPENLGSYNDAFWYAGMADREITKLIGKMDSLSFGWRE